MTKYGLRFKTDELGTATFFPPFPPTNYSFLAPVALQLVGAKPLTRVQFQKQTFDCVLPN